MTTQTGPMDASAQFCLNLACSARGRCGDCREPELVPGSGYDPCDFPGSRVTLTLDNRVPLAVGGSSTPTDAYHGGVENATLLQVLAEGQSTASGGTIQVSLSGTFDVAVVVSQSWSPGSHTIRATESVSSLAMRSVELTFMVEPQPVKLVMTPAGLDFGMLKKGDKATQTVTMSNTGQQPLDWTADVGTATWLTLGTSAGTLQPGTSQPIQVTASTTQLPPGQYSATLAISAGSESMQVAVTLGVVALPTPTPIPSTPTPQPPPPAVVPTQPPPPPPTPKPKPAPTQPPPPPPTPKPKPTPTQPPPPTPAPAQLCHVSTRDFGQIPHGQSASAPVTFDNCGGQPLNWNAQTDGSPWLSLGNTSGTVDPGGSTSNLGERQLFVLTRWPGTGEDARPLHNILVFSPLSLAGSVHGRVHGMLIVSCVNVYSSLPGVLIIVVLVDASQGPISFKEMGLRNG